jgi:glycosyltransferase involved in cell wall biosynthesis
MGYLARNWVHTFDKHPDKIDYEIFSRADPWLTPLRWHGPQVIDGPEDMSIDNPPFWQWVERFKPDVILFQDQNIYGPSMMRKECERLRSMGIRLINYPDWIMRGDLELYRGLYDVNLSHVLRNHRWLVDAQVENPTYIAWGVITKNFPFIERNPKGPVRFYINLGTGTSRKGYQAIPRAIRALEGNALQRLLAPKRYRDYDFRFIATAVEKSTRLINPKFVNFVTNHPRCELRFQTANNNEGGLFNLGDVYLYPTTKEGVGLTITEALCTGMPVVTPNYPTMNEWMQDGVQGRLIRPAQIKKGTMPMDKVLVDTRHLAEIMHDYITNPSQIVAQSHAARARVESAYNWDHRDGQILELLGWK